LAALETATSTKTRNDNALASNQQERFPDNVNKDNDEVPAAKKTSTSGYQCYSPPYFDKDKLNTALTSVKQGELESWNVRDKLDRSETQTPCISFQNVNGVENKKGIENKKGTCVAEQKEM
jgi:hypothetical protein